MVLEDNRILYLVIHVPEVMGSYQFFGRNEEEPKFEEVVCFKIRFYF